MISSCLKINKTQVPLKVHIMPQMLHHFLYSTLEHIEMDCGCSQYDSQMKYSLNLKPQKYYLILGITNCAAEQRD
jgi:hypothetical protein